MTDLSSLQCDQCGTAYDDQLPSCPSCGEPNTVLLDPYYDDELAQEQYYPEDDTFLHEELYPNEYRPENSYPENDLYYNDHVSYEYERGLAADPYTPQASYVDDYERDPFVPDGVDMVSQPAGRSWAATVVRFLAICLSLFICAGVYYGGIGVYAAYQGYQEQFTENQSELQLYYERGQSYLEAGNIERAIAEFQYALSIDQNFADARVALRDAEAQLEMPPTPTTIVQTGNGNELFAKAEEHIRQRRWPEAIQTLSQLRNVDLSYETDRVSEMLYTANYQLGLRQLTPDFVDEAARSFERALNERPGDPKAQTEYEKTQLYSRGRAALPTNELKAIELLSELYDADSTYMDVADKLFQAYEAYGDELALQGEWCQAKTQYQKANILNPSSKLKAKADNSGSECEPDDDLLAQGSTKAKPTPTSVPTATPRPTTVTVEGTKPSTADQFATGDLPNTDTTEATPTVDDQTAAGTANGDDATEPSDPSEEETTTAPLNGSILYSAFNKDEDEWHILSIPAAGGSSRFVARDGTQPAISNDGRFMLYRSTAPDAIGLLRFDFFTAEIDRMTVLEQDVHPRFGADNGQFLFAAQEPATGRWLIHQGFTNGLTEPVIVADGRTPDWATDGALAYQSTTPDGNNPGIYLAGFIGAVGERITTHESDRSPNFSPDGSQIAYMSTESGNWDIYVIARSGGEARKLTTYPGNDGLPVWSPDGAWLAYVSDEGGQWAIYVISAGGGSPSKVTPWSSLERSDWLTSQISWSPNP